MSEDAPIELRFRDGTLEVHGPLDRDLWPAALRHDPRTACLRAPAQAYRTLALTLHRGGHRYTDAARRWQTTAWTTHGLPPARPYQHEALAAWRSGGRSGVVVLPTGAGKSLLAVLAIADAARPTLVIAPTLDLVRQWVALLTRAFAVPIGTVGGGSHDVQPLTVTTYDSAHLHMRHLGDRFGMVVFDEVHHLPSEAYRAAAEGALAPFRLGLTATPERTDGREALIDALVGPIVYRSEIVEMSGLWLADYDTEHVIVEMDDDERGLYEDARALYRDFARAHGLRLGEPGGFARFLQLGGASPEGREAVAAYRLQRRLALSSRAKLRLVGALLDRHANDATIVFTDDNATAHLLARAFLVPVITHQTKLSERSDILQGLRSGRFGAVVTSRVLNEGVDVPEASVAIVVSGSGTVREHVQRLGRVLRQQPDKRARLYELVSAETSETMTSARRREHVAYR